VSLNSLRFVKISVKVTSTDNPLVCRVVFMTVTTTTRIQSSWISNDFVVINFVVVTLRDFIVDKADGRRGHRRNGQSTDFMLHH